MKNVSKFLKQPSFRAAVAAGAVVLSGFAHAADDGGAVDLMTAALVTVAAVGGASLAVYASIKVFKMIRSAL